MQIGLKTPLCLPKHGPSLQMEPNPESDRQRRTSLLENWFHPSRADNEERFTHLQLFVAKHVAISKLVWQRSHNDRRVMGPQLPPTVKVEAGLPNLPRTNPSHQPTEVLPRIDWPGNVLKIKAEDSLSRRVGF